MKPSELLTILSVAEKLKCSTRHCYTSSGRQESVAEHSWRISLMAMLVAPEFPDADMGRVIRMCLIHDLGEAFTGDIPTFWKTEADTQKEDAVFDRWGFPFADFSPAERAQDTQAELCRRRWTEYALPRRLLLLSINKKITYGIPAPQVFRIYFFGKKAGLVNG